MSRGCLYRLRGMVRILHYIIIFLLRRYTCITIVYLPLCCLKIHSRAHYPKRNHTYVGLNCKAFKSKFDNNKKYLSVVENK